MFFGVCVVVFFFSSRRRHTRCALVTGVQTCALPIFGNRNLQAALALVDESLARHQVVRLTAVHPSRAAAGKAVDKQAASSAGVQSGAARAAPDLHLRREVPAQDPAVEIELGRASWRGRGGAYG